MAQEVWRRSPLPATVQETFFALVCRHASSVSLLVVSCRVVFLLEHSWRVVRCVPVCATFPSRRIVEEPVPLCEWLRETALAWQQEGRRSADGYIAHPRGNNLCVVEKTNDGDCGRVWAAALAGPTLAEPHRTPDQSLLCDHYRVGAGFAIRTKGAAPCVAELFTKKCV